ncbi:Protein argonaute 2 [Glycine soja]
MAKTTTTANIGLSLAHLGLFSDLEKENKNEVQVTEQVWSMCSVTNCQSGSCGDLIQNFGMSVNTSITTIVGRVLGSPELKLGDPNRKIIKLTVDMEKCHWNLSGRSMVEGKPIEYWGILDFTSCGSYKYKLRGKEFIQKLIGVDVNHPGYQDTRSPSIAAVVATVNWPAANRYAARVFPQYNRSEKILNFGDVCLELVACYRRMNGVRPERIVIRDGVIVDTKVIHPFEFDFYLCSYYGNLGTSKPTHYHVLWDKHKFTSDELQKLIYEMCFTFAKCTKPVSLVPSVYYVDLAAYRGRLYREARIGMQSPKSTASSSSKDASSASRTASFELGFYTLHADLENIMFLI